MLKHAHVWLLSRHLHLLTTLEVYVHHLWVHWHLEVVVELHLTNLRKRHEHWKLLLHWWSHESLWSKVINISEKHLLAFLLTDVADVAILSVGEVIVEAFLASPVTNGVLLLLTILFHDSIVEMFGIFTGFFSTNFSFERSLGFLDVFGQGVAFDFNVLVDKVAIETLLPLFSVWAGASHALPATFWNLLFQNILDCYVLWDK